MKKGESGCWILHCFSSNGAQIIKICDFSLLNIQKLYLRKSDMRLSQCEDNVKLCWCRFQITQEFNSSVSKHVILSIKFIVVIKEETTEAKKEVIFNYKWKKNQWNVKKNFRKDS